MRGKTAYHTAWSRSAKSDAGRTAWRSDSATSCAPLAVPLSIAFKSSRTDGGGGGGNTGGTMIGRAGTTGPGGVTGSFVGTLESEVGVRFDGPEFGCAANCESVALPQDDEVLSLNPPRDASATKTMFIQIGRLK